MQPMPVRMPAGSQKPHHSNQYHQARLGAAAAVGRLPSAAALAKAMKENRLVVKDSHQRAAAVQPPPHGSGQVSALQARVKQLEAENASLRKQLSDVASCRSVLADIHAHSVLSMEHLMKSLQLSQAALNELTSAGSDNGGNSNSAAIDAPLPAANNPNSCQLAKPKKESRLTVVINRQSSPTEVTEEAKTESPPASLADDEAAIVERQLSRQLTPLVECPEATVTACDHEDNRDVAVEDVVPPADSLGGQTGQVAEMERSQDLKEQKCQKVENLQQEPEMQITAPDEKELKSQQQDLKQQLAVHDLLHADKKSKISKQRSDLAKQQLQEPRQQQHESKQKPQEQKLIEPKQHQLDPKQHQLDQKQHQLDQKQHQLDQKQHQLDPKQHQLDPKQHQLDPRQHPKEPKQQPQEQKQQPQEPKQQPQEQKQQPQEQKQQPQEQKQQPQEQKQQPQKPKQQPQSQEPELQQQKQEELEKRQPQARQKHEPKRRHQEPKHKRAEAKKAVVLQDPSEEEQQLDKQNDHQPTAGNLPNPFAPRHRLARTPPKAVSGDEANPLSPPPPPQPQAVRATTSPPIRNLSIVSDGHSLIGRRGTFVIGKPPPQPVMVDQARCLLSPMLAESAEKDLQLSSSPGTLPTVCEAAVATPPPQPPEPPVQSRPSLLPKRMSSSARVSLAPTPPNFAGSPALAPAPVTAVAAEPQPDVEPAPPAPKRHRRKVSSSAALADPAADPQQQQQLAPRPRRQRAVGVNYKEPSANQKVRRGDPNWCKAAAAAD